MRWQLISSTNQKIKTGAIYTLSIDGGRLSAKRVSPNDEETCSFLISDVININVTNLIATVQTRNSKYIFQLQN